MKIKMSRCRVFNWAISAFSLALRVSSMVCAVFILSLVGHSQVHAEGMDILAPMIFHDEIVAPFESGEEVRISSTVTDNVGIKSVTLFYKSTGTKKYESQSMALVGILDRYEVAIPGIYFTKNDKQHNTLWVDYYIVAEDLIGNVVMRGYNLAPLRLSIANSAVSLISAKSQFKSKNKSKRKWIWVGLTVLAVGIVATADGSQDQGPGVNAGLSDPFTVTAEVPDSL